MKFLVVLRTPHPVLVFRVDQNILQTDIGMHHFVFVKVFQGLEKLLGNVPYLSLGQPRLDLHNWSLALVFRSIPRHRQLFHRLSRHLLL